MLAVLAQVVIEAALGLAGRAVGEAYEGRCCPDCGGRLPVVNAPRSWRQFMDGGRVCRQCGEFYQFVGGRPVSLSASISAPAGS